MKKIAILLLVSMLISCTNQENNKKLANNERIMLAYPDSAFTLLQKDSASICEMGKDAQMHYQITLFRINDLQYKPHTSDSMMLKVADYFEKRNNKVLQSQAYYCLGCIYRDLNNHPKAINYFLKAATTDSIHVSKELLGRCYYQLSDLEDNRLNKQQALLYCKKAYSYIKQTEDYGLTNACIMDISQYYYWLGNIKEYSKFLIIAKKNILEDHDTLNLRRFIVAEGEKAIYSNNQQKLKKLILEAKKELTPEQLQDWGINMMQGYLHKFLHQQDSALYYFQKGLKIEDPWRKYEASIVMSETKADEYKYEEAWNLQKEAIKLKNEIDSIDNKSEAEKMKAAYNYEEEVAKREEAEEARYHFMLGIMVAICCILGLSSFILYIKNSSKKKELLQLRVIAQQNKEITQQKTHIQSQETLIQCQKTQIENQNEDIQKLENRNNHLSKYELLSSDARFCKIGEQIHFHEDKWNQFRMSEAYTHLHRMINDGLTNYKASDYKKAISTIKVEIDKLFNDYGKRLKAAFPEIKDSQITFAYLVKADVKFSNIAILLNKSKPSITKTSKGFLELLEKPYTTKELIEFLQNF